MTKVLAVKIFRDVFDNTRKLFLLAWAMDRRIVIFYYATSAVGALVPLLGSYALKFLIDDLQRAQGAALLTIPIVIVFLLAVRSAISLLDSVIYWGINQSYLDYVFRYKLQNEITLRFQKKISSLDIAYFEKPEIQDLITKTRDTMQWRLPDHMRFLAYLIRDGIAFVAAFLVLLPYGWWAPIVISIITIPRLFFQAKYGAIQWSLWGSGAPQARKLWYLNYLLQEPMTVRETRIAQSSGALLEKFQSLQEHLFDLNKKALDRYLRVLTFPPLLEVILIFFISYTFLPQVLSGALTIGSFTLIVSMLEQLGSRAANASARFGVLYEGNLYLNHFFEFLSLPPLVPVAENPVHLLEIKPPHIEFRNVSFRYAEGPWVLENISFIIEPGESVALVGHNGAGKTTIVKLLCRFYDVTAGEILVNGTNLKDLDPIQWYRFLGTLFQEFVKYHFTVRENITLGSPSKKDEAAIREAAKRADAAEFIERLPEQYDQMLGREFEDGEELSGGQWQKLAIARAFYEAPPVLILDEPTSAIDAAAEYDIFNNLEQQYENKTLILVSHRFSTVRNAEKIIVIDRGKIVESGSHDVLMKLGGQYAKLFTLQARGYR